MTWPNLQHFSKSEFDHPERMQTDILLLLEAIRVRSGCRIKVTSDYRTKDEHELIYPDPATRPNSPHQRGTAVDFKPVPFNVSNRLLVLEAITGLYKEGKCPSIGLEIADRHFHIDLDYILTRPLIWLGKSK